MKAVKCDFCGEIFDLAGNIKRITAYNYMSNSFNRVKGLYFKKDICTSCIEKRLGYKPEEAADDGRKGQ